MASSINVIIKTILSIFIYCNCLNLIKFVKSSRADLGTYLHIAPAIEEKSSTLSSSSSSSSSTIPEELYVLAFINYTYIADGREVHYSEEKGRYGEGKILNVQGFLEHITSADDIHDHTACTLQIRGTNGNQLPQIASNKPWIALIRRGKCTFEEKIKNAWKYGAVGVIVYNEIPAVSLEKMKIIEKDRNITAIFTYKWIGEELGRIVDEGNHIWVSISEGQRGMKPQHNINNSSTKLKLLNYFTRHLLSMNGTSVLFVSISFIVLMIISLVWLIFYYIQRFRYLQSKDQHSRHLCAVAKRVIMKIPTKSGKSDDKDSENDCCAICIEPYKATDCIRVLPCNHEFHKNCIDPWLLEHRTCPMCKLDVLKHYGFVVGDPYQKLSSNNSSNTMPSSHSQIRNNNSNTSSSSSNSSNDTNTSNNSSNSNNNNNNNIISNNNGNSSSSSSDRNSSSNDILTSVVVSSDYYNGNTNDLIHPQDNNQLMAPSGNSHSNNNNKNNSSFSGNSSNNNNSNSNSRSNCSTRSPSSINTYNTGSRQVTDV